MYSSRSLLDRLSVDDPMSLWACEDERELGILLSFTLAQLLTWVTRLGKSA